MLHRKKKNVWLVFGTRPEAVKMAPVYVALKEMEDVDPSICITAQHREMLDHVLNVFDMVPDYDLNLMSPGQKPHGIGGQALTMLGDLFERHRPDMVLVQGDTTTTFVASLAAFYNRVPVGHVEAGLRTGRLDAPFPEEANRVLTTRIADLHFAPTKGAAKALLDEGVDSGTVHVTGNTVIDALFLALEISSGEDLSPQQAEDNRRVLLVTAHRRESFGPQMDRIFKALRRLAQRGDVQVVIPLHPNPNVRRSAEMFLMDIENITVIEPMKYLPFVHLMNRSHLILTDSGGIQEEAPSLGIPVLVMREVTERPEAKDAGVAVLVGTDEDTIYNEACRLLDNQEHYDSMAQRKNPFGDGKAGRRIADITSRWLFSKAQKGENR